MPVSFQRILNSRLCKFVVGEEADGTSSEFFVHEEAIAQLSKPLHDLTRSGLSDVRAGSTTWSNVGKETFERFAQFAYTGDYTIPKPEKRSKPNGVSAHPSSPNGANGIQRGHSSYEADEAPPAELRDSPLTRKHKKKKKGKTVNTAPLAEPVSELGEPQSAEQQPVEQHTVAQQQAEEWLTEPQLQPAELEPEATPLVVRAKHSEEFPPSPTLAADFKSLSYPLLASRDNYQDTCEPAPDFDKELSYSNVLLSHASLYVLGDVQLIHSLKALALFKLHKTLCAFQLDEKNIGDITDLARYAYSKQEGEFDDGIGGLRGLLCQYMAMHAVELSHDTKFMNLLAEGGQIVKDFFTFQLQRVGP